MAPRHAQLRDRSPCRRPPSWRGSSRDSWCRCRPRSTRPRCDPRSPWHWRRRARVSGAEQESMLRLRSPFGMLGNWSGGLTRSSCGSACGSGTTCAGTGCARAKCVVTGVAEQGRRVRGRQKRGVMPIRLTGNSRPQACLWSNRCDRPPPYPPPRAGEGREGARSALPCFEPALCLVDHIDPPLASHNTIVAVATPQ